MLHLNKCQLLQSLKKLTNDSIVLKPFIALNKSDFIFDSNTFYVGVFTTDNAVVCYNHLNGKSVKQKDTEPIVFTTIDLENWNSFTGYQVISKHKLYEPTNVSVKVVQLQNQGEYNNHPNKFQRIRVTLENEEGNTIQHDLDVYFLAPPTWGPAVDVPFPTGYDITTAQLVNPQGELEEAYLYPITSWAFDEIRFLEVDEAWALANPHQENPNP